MIKANILIVVDEYIVVKDIETRLKNLGYTNVYMAMTGEKAVKEAVQKKPDLIIIDIKLKGKIDGIEVVKEIRAQLNIPVIYLSAYADENTLKRANITEPYGYILKPFRNTELHCNIQMALYKHNAEKEAKISSEKLKRIIDGVDDMILSVNKDGKITTWNNTLAAKTGFSNKEMLNKNIFKDKSELKLAPLWQLAKDTLRSKKSSIMEHEIKDKYGNKLILLLHSSTIWNDDGSIESVVLICRDISYENNLHKQLVPGNAYVSYEADSNNIISTLKSLAKNEYSLLCISRDDLGWVKTTLPPSTCILLSNEKKEGIISEAEPTKLLKMIKSRLGKGRTLVYLNRLEYISMNYGQKALFGLLYGLSDAIRYTQHMAIIRAAEGCLNKEEITRLKEEFKVLPQIENNAEYLDTRIKSVLKFISQQNSSGNSVPYNYIGRQFNISRATTKKWLSELQKNLQIKITKNGRQKHIFITEKGKKIIDNK